MPQSSKPFPFLEMPAELRSMTYNELGLHDLSTITIEVTAVKDPACSKPIQDDLAVVSLEDIERLSASAFDDNAQPLLLPSTTATSSIESARYTVHTDFHIGSGKTERELFNDMSKVNMLKVCKQIREDILPGLSTSLVVSGHRDALCWYAAENPQIAPYVRNVVVQGRSVGNDDLGDENNYDERWIRQILRLFPNLDYLLAGEFHRHHHEGGGATGHQVDWDEHEEEDEDEEAVTHYGLAQLKLMKTIMDNSRFKYVSAGGYCGGWRWRYLDGCFPECTFVTDAGRRAINSVTTRPPFNWMYVDVEAEYRQCVSHHLVGDDGPGGN